MDIGKMTTLLTLQQAGKAPDGMGGGKVTYTDITSLWGNVRPLSGTEYFAGQKLTNKVTHRIRIRYDERVKAKHRFVDGNRIFEIEAAFDPDERKAEMLCICAEKVN